MKRPQVMIDRELFMDIYKYFEEECPVKNTGTVSYIRSRLMDKADSIYRHEQYTEELKQRRNGVDDKH